MEHCEEASVSRALTEWALTEWALTEWALIEWALGGGLFRVCTLMLPLPQGHLTLNPALWRVCHELRSIHHGSPLQVIVSAVCNC